MSRAIFAAHASTPDHVREAPEVLFVHEGSLRVRWADGELVMAAGDTLTLPIGLTRRLASDDGASVFIVRGAA